MSSDPSTRPARPEETSSGSPPDWLSNKPMGWVFLVLAVLLVGGQLYTLSQVIAPLTKPPKFTEQLIQKAIAQDSHQSEASFYVSLEYAAAQIRAINCQIAIASVGGFFLIVVGMLLFASGAVKPFSVEAKDSTSGSLTLVDVAPGAFTALLGAVIMAMGILRPMTRTEISYEGSRPVAPASPAENQATIVITPAPAGIGADYNKNNTQLADPNQP